MTARASLILAGLTLTLVACSGSPATPTTPAEVSPPNTVAPSATPAPADETTEQTPQNPTLNDDGGYDFGAKVTTRSGIAVQITNVKRGKAPDADKKGTKKGDPIVTFTYKVTNESKEVWKGEDTRVIVVDGDTVTEVEEYLGAEDAGDAIGATLPPGKSKTTTLAYAVPTSVTYLVAETTVYPETETLLFTGDLK